MQRLVQLRSSQTLRRTRKTTTRQQKPPPQQGSRNATSRQAKWQVQPRYLWWRRLVRVTVQRTFSVVFDVLNSIVKREAEIKRDD